MTFKDRRDAGRVLAGLLQKYANQPDVVVLALPRGGVPVGYEIARLLNLPLDVFVVRKLGVPGHEELAMGAVATGGVRYLNEGILDAFHIDAATIDEVRAIEEKEIERRERVYRDNRPPLLVQGRTIILVDDGLATGSTMRAAIEALRQRGASRIVVAVPAGAIEVCKELAERADEAICATMPESFHAVSQAYAEFTQTTDQEVRELLSGSRHSTPVSIPANGETIQGDLAIAPDSIGIVIFSHGSGSSRHSPRNKFVADVLNHHRISTLLLDLLTPDEEDRDSRTLEYRFDIGLLAKRLVNATDWLMQDGFLSTLPAGYFGSSTGAAAALVAAAERPQIQAIVSRGGRPDLAGSALRRVAAPTLCIVGERDPTVLQVNREAARKMPGQVDIRIVPGATHLFEEPGALDEVAAMASEWFVSKLVRRAA
ncbi:MAG TPA: phosphoribosyltransferase family protein [Terriglobia bacterium]|nr:phosphoribosyltransferase family protein [Terriglobia bacterium]